MFWRRNRRATEAEANQGRDAAEPDGLTGEAPAWTGLEAPEPGLDAVQTREAETAPAETVPAETAPAETAPAEDDLVAEEVDEPDDEDDADDADDADDEDLPEDMTADLEAQARDYLADNDTWMYGPNASEALAVLDRLEEVGPPDASALVEAWRTVPKAEREVARKAARKLAESDADIERHLRLARESVGTWIAVSSEYPDHVKAAPEWARLCAQAGEAALDALTGIILEDELDEADVDSLVGPWTEAIGEAGPSDSAAGTEGEAAPDEAPAVGEDEDEGDEEDDEPGAYGPNSAAVTDMLNRLWLLTPEQVGRLVAIWQQTPREALDRAHAHLHELVERDPEWRYQVRSAQDNLGPWLGGGAREDTSAYLGRTGQGEVRRTAGPPLADAVAALVMGDLLEPEDAATLYDPWLSLMGTPPLPQPAERPAGEAGGGLDGQAPGVEDDADEDDPIDNDEGDAPS